MKTAYIFNCYNNSVVIKTYLDTVKEALSRIGFDCRYTSDLKSIGKSSLLVFPMGVDATKYYFKGFHNFILWQQGVTADESYMRNHSRLRHWILNKIDLFAMRKAKVVLFVSQYMKEHYEEMGKCSFSEKSYVMPCFNEEYDPSVYANKDYSKKYFAYVGSLDLWQCFDKTVALYKQIEESIPDTHLKVLTFDTQKAEVLLNESGVKNYVVKCVPKEKVKHELQPITYGFIIRDDNIVNRVATPTKFSSYLSAGVIPIFSSCLVDFAKQAQKMTYAKSIEDFSATGIEELIEFVNRPVNATELNNEYRVLFDEYYGQEYHCSNMCALFSEILK